MKQSYQLETRLPAREEILLLHQEILRLKELTAEDTHQELELRGFIEYISKESIILPPIRDTGELGWQLLICLFVPMIHDVLVHPRGSDLLLNVADESPCNLIGVDQSRTSSL